MVYDLYHKLGQIRKVPSPRFVLALASIFRLSSIENSESITMTILSLELTPSSSSTDLSASKLYMPNHSRLVLRAVYDVVAVGR